MILVYSRNKKRYMFELWTTDSPDKQKSGYYFDDDLSADFCEFFFAICLDQIQFMENLLRLDQIESRIDWYVQTRAKHGQKPFLGQGGKITQGRIYAQ